jgi:hypothetical protein
VIRLQTQSEPAGICTTGITLYGRMDGVSGLIHNAIPLITHVLFLTVSTAAHKGLMNV